MEICKDCNDIEIKLLNSIVTLYIDYQKWSKVMFIFNTKSVQKLQHTKIFSFMYEI